MNETKNLTEEEKIKLRQQRFKAPETGINTFESSKVTPIQKAC